MRCPSNSGLRKEHEAVRTAVGLFAEPRRIVVLRSWAKDFPDQLAGDLDKVAGSGALHLPAQ